MRKALTWMLIVVFTTSPLFAQARADWTAVTQLSPGTPVRISGSGGRKTGAVETVDDTKITVQGNTFDRASIQRVELVVGNMKSRERIILKGLGWGAAFAGIWTVFGVLGGFQGFTNNGEIAAGYGVILGTGVGIGALKSIGKGPTYVRIYERP